MRNAKLYLGIVLMAVVGCGMEEEPFGGGTGAGGKADDGSGQFGVVIDETGDGLTFEVIEGQDVIVRLPSNPSTGYDWQVASTDRTFGYPVAVVFTPAPTDVGEGGVTELVWKTDGFLSMLGSHTVVLEYRRAWEQAELPADDSFTFTVAVCEATAGAAQ